MTAPRILSVNVGRVAPLFVDDQGAPARVMSGIRKAPVTGPVALSTTGLAGDEQADLSVHGGADKAVYLYPSEHYDFWVHARQRARGDHAPLPFGFIGENLSTEGVLEQDLWVGDRLQAGDAVLEVTEPRAPCYKFAARMGFSHAVRHMLQSGFTGVYLKVVVAAAIEAGMTLTLVPGPRETRIATINGWRLKGRQRDLFP